LLAEIGELDRDFAANVIVDRRRNADAAGFSDGLQPCGDVDAVPKDVMRLDHHVAHIDADTESNPSVFCICGSEFFDAGLEL
jgi:hypothetical protein